MRNRRGPIAPGYVRRISPTACRVMPFTGSTVDDMSQLRLLAQQYARQVPFGLDWPVNFWADKIGWETDDHAARTWLNHYFQSHSIPEGAMATRHGNPETKH